MEESASRTLGDEQTPLIWEETAGWTVSDTGSSISYSRNLQKQELRTLAARSQTPLLAGNHAHLLRFVVYQWSGVVGVTDAKVEFASDRRFGGRSWGFEVMGCLFYATRNAFELGEPLTFPGVSFNGHVGGYESKLGFMVELLINWPTRDIFCSLWPSLRRFAQDRWDPSM